MEDTFSFSASNLLPPDSPFSIGQIVDTEIDTFNDLMGRYNMSETKIMEYRDIRRKGKNRVRPIISSYYGKIVLKQKSTAQKAARKSRKKRMEGMDQLKKEVERLGNDIVKCKADNQALQNCVLQGSQENARLQDSMAAIGIPVNWTETTCERTSGTKEAVLFGEKIHNLSKVILLRYIETEM